MTFKENTIIMQPQDDFTLYHKNLLDGRYDCVDRIVLNGYFPLGHQGGGFRTWWRKLTGSDDSLDQQHLKRMAARFSRRVRGWAKKKAVPVIYCAPGVRKHELAQKYMPQHPHAQGLFLILVAKAPGLVWKIIKAKNGQPHLQRKSPWPYINHYHFHIIDPDWGHITIKISGYPPFSIQVMLNGHQWVERQALKQTISVKKEGNCFVGGSFQALDQLANTLCDHHTIGRLTEVCDRWVYSSCLCFALDLDEQLRSGFRYRYSVYQIEYSRNLLFTRGTVLDAVYQGLIDRTRQYLDVPKLCTLFGYKNRPHNRRGKKSKRLQRILDQSAYDLTVFKLHFGPMTLKLYDKGPRVLRVEAIAHNTKGLRCGKLLEKLPIMLNKLQDMAIGFLNVVQAAHRSFLPDDTLDSLIKPSQRGNRRLAGVDLQQPRIQAVSKAVLALAPKPQGFTVCELAEKTRQLYPAGAGDYTHRQAAYDLMKLRGKNLVERISTTRYYRIKSAGIRILAGLLILREKVIKPVLAGFGKPRVGRPLHEPAAGNAPHAGYSWVGRLNFYLL
jgi:DNA-binding transcriptional ArsR family regulator